MTFRDALDTAHTLLVDELVRLGGDLVSTLEDRKEWAAGSLKPAVATAGGTVRTPQPPAVDNDASLMQLMGQLKGSGFKGR
jgi:hypothetical protein